jgi:hypothetical protein
MSRCTPSDAAQMYERTQWLSMAGEWYAEATSSALPAVGVFGSGTSSRFT